MANLTKATILALVAEAQELATMSNSMRQSDVATVRRPSSQGGELSV